MRSGARPRAATVKVTVSGVAVKDAGHGLGEGKACRARAMSGAPVGCGPGSPAATASVSETGASSGMHSFSQTSQLARPDKVTRAPGTRSAGAVIGMGSTTSFE